MTTNPLRSKRFVSPFVLAVLVALAGATSAVAADRARDRHPGVVDGSEFAALAHNDDKLIEVNIHGPLLRMVAQAVGHESEELADLLGQIVSISAVVLELGDDSAGVRALADDMAETLEGKGWELLARIRESDTNVTVMVLHDSNNEELNGLVVFVSDDGDKFVFVNIAGRIDLGLVGKLGMQLGVPGLEELTGGAFHSSKKAKGKKHSKKRHRE